MNNAVREILLVEPEQVVSEVTGFRLELLGYRVICVESAEAAFVKISESTPDLLITDLVLPGLDGIGFIEQLLTAGVHFYNERVLNGIVSSGRVFILLRRQVYLNELFTA